MITDDASRRRFPAGLAGAGLLTACGGAPTPVAAPAGVALTDDRGQVALPAVPERIVTTSEEATELVVALGLRPVGLGSGRVDPVLGLTEYHLTPEQIGSPEFVGSDPYDLEAIAALDPDLIVHYTDDQDAATFASIAPAVYDVTVPGAWAQALRLLGAVAGREREAEAVIAAYDRDRATARDRLAPVEADTVLAVGSTDWRETPSAVVLDTLASPVLWLPLDLTRPSAGPLTSPDLLRGYVDDLATRYGF